MIHLADAGKRFTKYEDSPMLITAALRLRARTRRSQLWAIRHVDLDVAAGESVGIIGRNGSGKSTLLQMIAGVTAPTEGVVRVDGRVAPLISVGVGFHPELTGRENVYVNGTILGLTRAQIDERLDAIVAFAEIEQFVDTPVKFYSSGMFVRLGFASAVYAEPEVLLVDEVLAVGDFAFQMKCFDRMAEIREAGTTIVAVSHNLNSIRALCSRAMLVHDGSVQFLGGTDDAVSKYHDLLEEQRDPDLLAGSPDSRSLPGVARISSLQLLDAEGRPTHQVRGGEAVTFRLDADFDSQASDLAIGVMIRNATGVQAYAEIIDLETAAPEVGRTTLDVGLRVRLGTGTYTVAISVGSTHLGAIYDTTKPMSFYVAGRHAVRSVADLEATVRVALPDDEL
jgi:ABC-type polysaccharide/polyol phosphate transport system ATPase subunit